MSSSVRPAHPPPTPYKLQTWHEEEGALLSYRRQVYKSPNKAILEIFGNKGKKIYCAHNGVFLVLTM